MRKYLLSFPFYGLLFAFATFSACNENEASSENTPADTQTIKAPAPDFNPDRAYELIKTQLAFGPRVPGSEAQTKCAEWMQAELRKYADTVYVQQATVKQAGSGKEYPSINLVASFNPTMPDRVLILAHWDSRPWADEDSVDKTKPVAAADDGASGVAVMMEIASNLKGAKLPVGVDLLFVDAEDVGKTEWTDESWCLGTQYWARNPHVAGYRAMFGIGLDMVGARGARFPLEGNSSSYAGSIQREIWETAAKIGYGNYFVMEPGGTITDDHLVVNNVLQIPCVDIINLAPNGSFGAHWHTHQDDLGIIDKATLKAVGQTVLQVIYNQ